MKLAVVGCEASGKTVFMSALADYYGREAANHPSRLKLTPENDAANKFERLMLRQMRVQHEWPSATPPEKTTEIKWSFRRKGEVVASVELLEFGGETFRAAFREGDAEKREGSAAELLQYLGDADFFVVLVSIKALLAHSENASADEADRETEALWVTRGILDFIRKNRPKAGVVIGLTQADKYRYELGDLGDARTLLAAHWPTVASAIGDIPVVDVASVSKTDENGNPVDGYHTRGILPVMRIFAKRCFGSEEALETGIIPLIKNPSLWKKAVAALAGLLILGGGLALELLGPGKGEKIPAEPLIVTVTNTVEKAVPVEKIVRTKVLVTNTVEKVVEKVVKVKVPVTNTVEKVVEKVVKVKVPVTNTVEKVVEKVVKVNIPVTNTVEKIVKVERVVTNVVEKVIEKPAPTNVTAHADAELQKQIPPGYRVWTDFNGRKIVAKWVGVAEDGDGITIVSRFDRRIDAVLWKFSADDQAYIKAEIKRHAEKGERMVDGEWVKARQQP